MNNNNCPLERETIHAVKSGVWTERQRQHAVTCSVCSETLLITRTMESVREAALEHTPSLPAYRLLWLKAQFNRKQEHLSKLDLITLLGLSLVGALAFIGVLFWKIPQLHQWTTNVVSASSPSWLSLIPMSVPIAVVVAFLIAVWVFSLEFFFARRY